MVDVVGPVVSQEMIEARQRLGIVRIPAFVDDIDVFAGVRFKQTHAPFGGHGPYCGGR